MSFFDDDEPTRAARSSGAQRPRPRRPAPAAPGGHVDDQTLLVRRLAAAGIGLLVLILLVVGIKGCVSSRRATSLKDYTRGVAAVITASQQSVATPLFQLLNQGGAATDLTGPAQQLRLEAESQVKQASALSVPGGLDRAQGYLMLVLNLRANAIAKIADRIPSALAQGRANAQTAEDAVDRIAGQMRAFDASDVVYSQRVKPEIEQALTDADVNGPALPAGQFLPDVRWLQPDQVAGVLGAQRANGGTGVNPNPPAGLHGHSLTSVAVGANTLTAKPAVNHIKSGANVTFAVTFMNGGDFDERDVVIKVSVAAGTSKPITGQHTVDLTKSKQSSTANVALGSAPPIGKAATITVTVEKVPGEKSDPPNNTQSFTAIFE